MIRIVLFLFLIILIGCGQQDDISYTGSNSVLDPIQDLIKEYGKKEPEVRFTEDGYGSDSFHLDRESIYGQSREMKAVEKEWADKFGPIEHKKIAYGALAIIINPLNPVDELSMEQLKDIYTGKITNWLEVGGQNAPITVLGRGGRSGSEDYFEQKVLKDEKITGRRYRLFNNDQVIEAIDKHKYAIGYVEIGYLDENNVKALALRQNQSSQAILPEYENLKNDSYPLIRPLYLLTLIDANQDVKDFVKYVLSDEGQKVIKKAGYLPVKEKEE